MENRLTVARKRTGLKWSGGGHSYEDAEWGCPFVVMEEFWILIVGMVIQIFTWDKVAQNYTHTQPQKWM